MTRRDRSAVAREGADPEPAPPLLGRHLFADDLREAGYLESV
jgi:hypothetical protein